MISPRVDTVHSWIIAVLCSSMYFLCVGIFKVHGLLFVETMYHFDASRKSASLTFLLCSISRSFIGPISGYFGHKFGLPVVIISGILISSTGIILCFFATNIVTIYILYGGIVGLGFGLCGSLLPQVINIHFKKHFSKAYGIMLSGGSIGGFILSPVVERLLDTFGLLGTFMILGGILLHGIPISLILRFLMKSQTEHVIKTSNQNKLKTVNVSQQSNEYVDKDINSTSHINILMEEKNENGNKTFKTNIPVSITTRNKNKNSFVELESYNSKVEPAPSSDILHNKRNSKNNESDFQACCPPQLSKDNSSKCIIPSEYEISTDKHHLGSSAIKINHSIKTVQPHPFKVFLNISYLIIAFGIGNAGFLMVIYPTVCVDFSLDKGMTVKESTYLLMIFIGTNLTSTLSLGWIIDSGYVTKTSIGVISFILSTTSSLFTAWSQTFVTMMLSMGLQAISLALLFITIPALIPQYIEKHSQIVAMASSTFFLVPLSAISPILIGHFRDDLGSYKLLMYFLAAVGVFNGSLLFILPYIEKRKLSRENTK